MTLLSLLPSLDKSKRNGVRDTTESTGSIAQILVSTPIPANTTSVALEIIISKNRRSTPIIWAGAYHKRLNGKYVKGVKPLWAMIISLYGCLPANKYPTKSRIARSASEAYDSRKYRVYRPRMPNTTRDPTKGHGDLFLLNTNTRTGRIVYAARNTGSVPLWMSSTKAIMITVKNVCQ